MKKTLFLAAFSLLMSNAVMAQDCCADGGKLKSYSFVEVQGGLEWTTTDAKIDKLLMPIGAVSVGHYFTPVVGARLHVSGIQAKGRFESMDKDYKWNFITTNADVLINLTNLFSKNYSHPLNLIFVGGIGLSNAWKNDDMKEIVNNNPNMAPLAWTSKNRLSHNLRAGLRLETNVTKPIGVSLEFDANSMDDRFNSKTNDADDWMISGMIGLSYRFGYKKECCKKVEPVKEPEPIPVVEPAPVPVVEKKLVKKVIEKEQAVKLHKEVFYAIRVSANETPSAIMEQVANFIKENKNTKVSIVGYADKGTGNPTINKKYAANRANQFKDDLVKRYGVDPSIITTDSKGDTVQPFAENDKNRCVIIDGEGIRVIKETIEVEE